MNDQALSFLLLWIQYSIGSLCQLSLFQNQLFHPDKITTLFDFFTCILITQFNYLEGIFCLSPLIRPPFLLFLFCSTPLVSSKFRLMLKRVNLHKLIDGVNETMHYINHRLTQNILFETQLLMTIQIEIFNYEIKFLYLLQRVMLLKDH